MLLNRKGDQMSQKEIIKYCGADGRLLIPKSMREALHL